MNQTKMEGGTEWHLPKTESGPQVSVIRHRNETKNIYIIMKLSNKNTVFIYSRIVKSSLLYIFCFISTSYDSNRLS